MSRPRLLSQLGHIEITTPKLEESTRFFVDVLGLEESAREANSVYLRCWGEWFHNSVILTEGPEPTLVHIGWRAEGQAELEQAAKVLEESGVGEGWVEQSVGHGPAYRFRVPGGGINEIYWEAERYKAPEHMRSTFPNRPQRYTGRGVACRQLDHVTMPTKDLRQDVKFWRDVLGFRFMEYAVLDEDRDHMFFAEMSTNEQAHDLGLLNDSGWVPGRIHHLAFWLDQNVDVLRAADTLLENGAAIEYGPGRHGHGENTYLYFREPGGMRIELFSGGYRNYQPDWEPIEWRPSQGSLDMTRAQIAPDSMLDAFPLAKSDERIKVGDEFENPWALEGVR
jgi:catechol 2,3-dioxygenase